MVDFHKTGAGLATPPPEQRVMLCQPSELLRRNKVASEAPIMPVVNSIDLTTPVYYSKMHKNAINASQRSESMDSTDEISTLTRHSSLKHRRANSTMTAISEQKEHKRTVPLRASSVDGDGIDSKSEPGTLLRVTRKPSVTMKHYQRATTPPPKPPPPRSFHSDMYSTAFALQSLGDPGWSDYVTKVRTMWDGHMSHRGTNSKDGAKETSLDNSYSSPSVLSSHLSETSSCSLSCGSGLGVGEGGTKGMNILHQINTTWAI